MKTLAIICLGLILLTSLTCQQKLAMLTDAQKAEIEKQVTDRQLTLFKILNDKDPQAFSQLLSSMHFSTYISQSGSYWNRQALIDTVKAWWPGRQAHNFTPITIKANPLSSDLAIADAILTGSMTRGNGAILKMQISISVVWQKEPSGWYIVHYHDSWKYLE